MASSIFRIMIVIIPYFLIAYMYFYIMMIQRVSLTHEIMESLQQQQQQQLLPVPRARNKPHDFATSNTPLQHSSSSKTELLHRLHLLESKLNSFLGFGRGGDPFESTKVPAKCKHWTKLEEYCDALHDKTKGMLPGTACHLGMPICLDKFPYKDCIVYDFGIREQPDFGVIMSLPPFSCKVYAFDPSPITQKWYASPAAKKLRDTNPNYFMFHYGGSFEDGTLELKEYNWDQVSVYQYPNRVVDPTNCTATGHCRYHKHAVQRRHILPVRSIPSIMNEFGHTKVDVLKLDVEGSEYRMLESIIEAYKDGKVYCQFIDQISLEWHHYDFDLRYGVSSIPQMNVLHKLLKEECGIQQFWLHDAVGWPSNEKIYADMQLTLRYNLAAFIRWPS